MAKEHLSNDEFFLRLSDLFDERRQKDHGSVILTQKRSIELSPPVGPSTALTYIKVSYGEHTEADLTSTSSSPDLTPSKPLPILIRATNGKSKAHRDEKIKLSTVVEADALEGFFVRYAELCKAGMSGLKKRDRSKAKEKLRAKKKKQGGAGTAAETKKA